MVKISFNMVSFNMVNFNKVLNIWWVIDILSRKFEGMLLIDGLKFLVVCNY